MNIFDQNVMKKPNCQNFIDSELDHMISNLFVKMPISEKYSENLWIDTEFFSIFVTKFFLITSCFVAPKIFNSKSNAATNFMCEENLNVVSMQNVYCSIRYVFKNIKAHIFFNFQIMIIIQNTIQENIKKMWCSIMKSFFVKIQFAVNITFQTLFAKNR